jgi:hypothetical protein
MSLLAVEAIERGVTDATQLDVFPRYSHPIKLMVGVRRRYGDG